MGIKRLAIKEGDRQMDVFIPETGDKHWDEELEIAETERTRDYLKQERKEKSKMPRKDVGKILKDYKEYQEAIQAGRKRHY